MLRALEFGASAAPLDVRVVMAYALRTNGKEGGTSKGRVKDRVNSLSGVIPFRDASTQIPVPAWATHRPAAGNGEDHVRQHFGIIPPHDGSTQFPKDWANSIPHSLRFPNALRFSRWAVELWRAGVVAFATRGADAVRARRHVTTDNAAIPVASLTPTQFLCFLVSNLAPPRSRKRCQ